jgi:hypothetical protein
MAIETRPSDWWRSPYWWLTIATLFLVAVTTVLVFLSWGQTRDIRVEEARRLRPYVVVQRLTPVKNYGAGQIPTVNIELENMGQTPVYDLAWQSGMRAADYPETGSNAHFSDCDAMMSGPYVKSFFGPRLSLPKNDAAALSADDIQAISGHHKALYLQARFCYRDIFGDEHWTDFCAMWMGDGDGLDNPTMCKYGNDADRDRR